MTNPYRRLREIIEKEDIDSEELLHALMASVFAESCDTCNEKFHSKEFAQGFQHLLREMRFCRNLSERPMTVPFNRMSFLDTMKYLARKFFSHPARPVLQSAAIPANDAQGSGSQP
jgi:hypothetical protein